MTFVKLTGEQGQDVWVKPLWVVSVDSLYGDKNGRWTNVRMIDGSELVSRRPPEEVLAALSPEPPNVRRMRSVGEQ